MSFPMVKRDFLFVGCTPTEAIMHDNGINDALMALNELKL